MRRERTRRPAGKRGERQMRSALQTIRDFYGEQRAKRSNELLIKHIYEGHRIMSRWHPRQATMDAYSLHPIFQSDEALKANRMLLLEFSPEVVMLVMEYRRTANNYLSEHFGHRMPVLSPLEEVNIMLRADKLQNFADFVKHHRGTHERSAELSAYFLQWCYKLGVGEEHNILAAGGSI